MCYLKNFRVCVVGVLVVSFISLTEAQCPGGWNYWPAGATCYYKAPNSGSDYKTRSEAAEACATTDNRATLVTIVDATEWNYVRTNVIGSDLSEYWIGLIYMNPVPDTLTSRKNRAMWYWVDGSAYSWANWKTSPDPEPSGEDQCIRLFSSGYWGDTFCTYKLRYICKLKQLGGTTQHTQNNAPSVAPSVAPSNAPSVAPSVAPSIPPSLPPSTLQPSRYVSEVSKIVTNTPPASSVSVFSIFGGGTPSTVSPSIVPWSKVPIIVQPSKVPTVTTTTKKYTPPPTPAPTTKTTKKTTVTTKKTTTTPKPMTTTNAQNSAVVKGDDGLNLPLLIGVSVGAVVIIVATIVIGTVVLIKKRRKGGDDASSEGATNSAFHAGERPSMRGREPERLPTWMEEKEEDQSPPPPPTYIGADDTGLL